MNIPGVINTRYGQDMAIVRTPLQWFLFIALFAIFVVMPYLVPTWFLTFFILTGVVIIAMLGLNLVMGYAGQISLGHLGFMAVGGFTSAILMKNLGWNFFPSLLVSGLMAALVGMVFGVPSLRLRGWYLAMATLAGFYVIIFVLDHLDITRNGFLAPSPSVAGFIFDSPFRYYYLALGLVAIMTFFAVNISRTKPGRAFVAIRDNDIAARIMGVNVYYYKLLAFALSAFYAGIAGSLLTHFLGMASTQYFPLMTAIWYLGFLVVGGAGSTLGVFFGAFMYRGLDELALNMGPWLEKPLPFLALGGSAGLALMLWAAIVIAFLVFEPRGMNHLWQRVKAYYRLHPFKN